MRRLDADNCVSLDAGMQYTANALPADTQPTLPAVNSANPPFCTTFGGKLNAAVCEEPWLFKDVVPIGAGTPFQPFAVMKPTYEPIGHPPFGVYGKRHVSVYFSLVPSAALEAAFPVGGCSRYGLISPAGFRRALTPVPVGCWPYGAQWKSRGLAIAHVGQHVYSLAGDEYLPPYNRLGALSYSYGYGDAAPAASARPSGALLWYEVKSASEALLALAASGKGELCQPLNGRPSEYAVAGYKPAAVCVAVTDALVTARVAKLDWHDAGCAVGPATKFDPHSFAPPSLEATDLNPACVAPSKLNATAFPAALADPALAAAGAASGVGAAAQLAGEVATGAALAPFDPDGKDAPLPPDQVAKTAAVIKRTIVG